MIIALVIDTVHHSRDLELLEFGTASLSLGTPCFRLMTLQYMPRSSQVKVAI